MLWYTVLLLQTLGLDTNGLINITALRQTRIGQGSIFPDPIQAIKYLILNRTRKLCVTNYSNGDF